MKIRKSYVVAIALGAVVTAKKVGWIPPGVADWLSGMLGAGGLASLRHAQSTTTKAS